MTNPNAALSRISNRTVPLAIAAFAALATLAIALIGPGEAHALKSNPRTIALTPFSANVLVELGYKPIAIGDIPVGSNQRFNAYNKKLRNVKRLTLTHANSGPNKEEVAKLRAKFMLTEHTWRESAAYFRDVAKLTLAEHDPKKVGQFKNRVARIGKLVGAPKKRIKKVQKKLAKKIKSTSKSKRAFRSRPKTLMLLGLGSGNYLAFLKGSWGNDVLTRAGGKNVVGNLSQSGASGIMFTGKFANISPEVIAAKSPEVLIVVPHGFGDQIGQIEQAVRNDTVIQTTPAYANNRICVVKDNSLLQPSTFAFKAVKKLRQRPECLGNW